MKKNMIMIGSIALIGMIYLAGCTSTTQNKNNGNTNSDYTSPPQQNATEVRIPISDIGPAAAFYSYDASGVTVRYFAVKDSSGNTHMAFDACDVCYEAKKGYKQNGEQMQCLNCGRQFAITSIGTENTAGGCWPSYLAMKIDGNDVAIKITDLEAKSFMF